MSAYDYSAAEIFVSGRTQVFVNNGTKLKMLTRNSEMEFDTDDTSVILIVSAVDPPNAYRIYINDVDSGLAAPVGAAGFANSQTITIAGLAGGGVWTNIRVMVTAGNEGAAAFVQGATVQTANAPRSLRFKGGQTPVNMVRELVGGATGQSLGLFNAPLQSAALGDNSTGNSSPFCIGDNWQVIGERRAKTNKIGVLMSSGGGSVGLYKDGVFQQDVVLTGSGPDGGGLTRWRLVIFAGNFDVNTFATYTVSVKSGPGLGPAYLDEIILFGDGSSTPAFDTTAVTRARSFAMWGDSIESAQIAGSNQSAVYGLQLAQEFNGKFYNRGFSGNTIAQVNTRFVADNVDISATEVTVVILGIGENDLATGQVPFTNAARDFINNAFARYTNCQLLVVRGIQPPDATYNGYLQDAIAASNFASKCLYVPTPAGISTVDGQHPDLVGYFQMTDAFDDPIRARLAFVRLAMAVRIGGRRSRALRVRIPAA